MTTTVTVAAGCLNVTINSETGYLISTKIYSVSLSDTIQFCYLNYMGDYTELAFQCHIDCMRNLICSVCSSSSEFEINVCLHICVPMIL